MRRSRALMLATLVALLIGGLPRTAIAASPPNISLGEATVAEPTNRNGTVSVEIPVTVHGAAAGGPISIGWRTVAGTATAADFVNASGNITVPAGSAGGSIALSVLAD